MNRNLEHCGHKIVIYTSIEDTLIKRFNQFNKYVLLDAGIGSNLQDILNHIDSAKSYINLDDKKNAHNVLDNMRQCIFFAVNNVSPKQMAFACLVKSIDGKEFDDISEDGLADTLEFCNKIKVTQTLIKQVVDAVKKKWMVKSKPISQTS